MKKLFLILITAFLMPVFVYSQSHQVTLRIKLYPIQVLEVNNHKSAEFNKHPKKDSVQLDIYKNLNTYSTSNFVLKVHITNHKKSLSPVPKIFSFVKDPSLYSVDFNQEFHSFFLGHEAMDYYKDSLDSHLLYSMEAL